MTFPAHELERWLGYCPPPEAVQEARAWPLLDRERRRGHVPFLNLERRRRLSPLDLRESMRELGLFVV